MSMILLIVLPATIMAGLAYRFKSRLNRLKLTVWLGVLLIGTGLPVLVGQLTALALTDMAEQSENMNFFIYPLVAGICGGLGWMAGAIAGRLSSGGFGPSA